MITADPSAAVLRPKYKLISFDRAPSMTIQISRDIAKRGAIRMSSGQNDHV